MLLALYAKTNLLHNRQKLCRAMLWRCQKEKCGLKTIKVTCIALPTTCMCMYMLHVCVLLWCCCKNPNRAVKLGLHSKFCTQYVEGRMEYVKNSDDFYELSQGGGSCSAVFLRKSAVLFWISCKSAKCKMQTFGENQKPSAQKNKTSKSCGVHSKPGSYW